MHGLGSKIHLKSSLVPQPVPLKLDSTSPSKGPFSANIHPIILKLSVPIPQGMCFLKIVGAPFENARVWTTVGFLQTRFKLTFQRSFLHEYASDHSQLCCAYSSGHVVSEMVGASFENAWVKAKTHLKLPLASHPAPMKLISMPHSKGPFSTNISDHCETFISVRMTWVRTFRHIFKY